LSYEGISTLKYTALRENRQESQHCSTKLIFGHPVGHCGSATRGCDFALPEMVAVNYRVTKNSGQCFWGCVHHHYSSQCLNSCPNFRRNT